MRTLYEMGSLFALFLILGAAAVGLCMPAVIFFFFFPFLLDLIHCACFNLTVAGALCM